jgi:hypothetical protein
LQRVAEPMAASPVWAPVVCPWYLLSLEARKKLEVDVKNALQVHRGN